MSHTRTIGVFCGSSPAADETFIALARAAGEAIADAGFGIVYGGSRNGLMGAAADAALEKGAVVTGAIPHFLKEKEVAHGGLAELILTDTMHERQVAIAERADAFLVLPGGLGTLAELFEVLTWRQLALHEKPVALLNGGGYWDSLLDFLRQAGERKFLYRDYESLFTVLENTEKLKVFLGGLKK